MFICKICLPQWVWYLTTHLFALSIQAFSVITINPFLHTSWADISYKQFKSTSSYILISLIVINLSMYCQTLHRLKCFTFPQEITDTCFWDSVKFDSCKDFANFNHGLKPKPKAKLILCFYHLLFYDDI